MHTRSSQGASAIAGALVAVLIAACSGNLESTSPLPSASSALATPSASKPSGSPAAVGPIAEAKYVSEPNDVPAIVARIKADPKLTASERAEWVNTYSDQPPTQVVGLEFSAGNFTETQAGAGGSDVGSRGRYAVADGKTLVLSGIGTFAVTPTSQGFALKMTKQELPGEVELLIASVLFESSPFTLETAAPQAIPDGMYVGRIVQVSQLAEMVNADKKLTAAQRTDLSELTTGHTTMQVQLGLSGGHFTEAVAFDGGAFEVGVRATYAFSDDRTLVTQSPSLDTFAVTWASGSFALHRTSTPADEGDAMFGKILFQYTPFSLVP